MFIVLEGLDGAGKSTQAALLREYISHRGTPTQFLHFPRFDRPVFGELIAKFLRGDLGAIDTVDPYIAGLLFAGDRQDAAAIIRAWLAEGACVVLDRYVYSNIAYQCAKLPTKDGQNALRDWIWNMEYCYFAIPQPDLTVFLDVPLTHVAQKLAEDRAGNDRAYLQGKKDIHEASMLLQENVRKIYLEQAALDPTFKLIDCSGGESILPPTEIFKKLQQTVNPLMGIK
jgi:dTMP kinase